jgi:hypothetical protein
MRFFTFKKAEVRATTRQPDLAMITAFGLAGIVLTIASLHFGLEVDISALS